MFIMNTKSMAIVRTAKVRLNGGAPTELRIRPLGKRSEFSEPAPSRVYLVGLSDVGGRKIAHFQEVPGAHQPKAKVNHPNLGEGQEEAGIEVLQIDMQTRTVTVRVDGSAPVQLTLTPLAR